MKVIDWQREMERRVMEIMWGGFYRCPTTGRIVERLPGDDKVICHCGQSNPKVPSEQTDLTGVHIARFMQPATTDEYLEQRDAERAAAAALQREGQH